MNPSARKWSTFAICLLVALVPKQTRGAAR